ncbi:sine oculis-binding protein homolog isoform X1 [Dendroctonus ponderosae]|nr:sine oculis-binding protein homolog isoform X1 [Dendroctonus ponderosae]KAH1027373.1 hypothetical protein HUJ05_000899 [Dendroctonus ponderosae]
MEKAPNNEVSITKVPAKKTDDIKSYAESTMNELLGWYGYDASRNDSKVSRNRRSFSESNESEAESVKFTEGCGWCGKSVDENSSVISSSAVFCSELCFSQSRRASFKRNKTCDWCRLARHTVSYVDCQDNAAQLQFCSEKCLNQYKMHIFCRETQAHLELHPHLHGAESTSSGLITPDLWLKNCTSPSSNNRSSPVLSPIGTNPSSQSSPRNLTVNSKPEHVPLISVAPSSKLLATDVKRNRTKVSKRFKKNCPSTITSLGAVTSFNDIPQDLRVRQTPPLDEVPVEEYAFKSSPKDDAKQVRSSLEENVDSQKNDGSPSVEEDISAPKLTPNNVRAILGNILPPPTTFVPYPVILPLPIPIPIPIPIPKMFKSNNGKDLIELKDSTTQTVDDINMNTSSILNEKNEIPVKPESAKVLVGNRRLLRKRKQVDVKSKTFLKHHKKTLNTLP